MLPGQLDRRAGVRKALPHLVRPVKLDTSTENPSLPSWELLRRRLHTECSYPLSSPLLTSLTSQGGRAVAYDLFIIRRFNFAAFWFRYFPPSFHPFIVYQKYSKPHSLHYTRTSLSYNRLLCAPHTHHSKYVFQPMSSQCSFARSTSGQEGSTLSTCNL